MRLPRRRLLVAFALTLNVEASAQSTLQDGLYTDEQAEQGAALYQMHCSSCHAADLGGNSNAPALTGMSFQFLWEGRSLLELYDQIRTTMPTDRPGSLTAAQYLAILSFVLASNDFPSGATELGPDLGEIVIGNP